MAWVKAAVAQAIAQLGSSRVGIYTNKNNWATVMGTLPGFPNLPLWVSANAKENKITGRWCRVTVGSSFYQVPTLFSSLSLCLFRVRRCAVRSLRQQAEFL
jgi:hypothetical protein